MKKILTYCLVGLLFLSTSCDDFLDKDSYTDHGAEILKTPEGMYALLNGVYDAFSHSQYYGRTMFGYEGAKGIDFFVRKSSGGTFERENRYAESTSSSGSAGGAWLKIYSAIRNATNVIECIDEVEGISDDEREMIHGEAAALRGLAYFDLMRLFAYPPVYSCEKKGEPGNEIININYNEKHMWGLPIIRNMDMVNNIRNYEIRRETAYDTYRYIEDNLLEGKEKLRGKTSRQGHINYVATCAILTRLYLYLERWDDAIEVGEEALAAAEGTYQLLGYDAYRTGYYKPFSSENLWELVASISDHNGSDSLNSLVRKPTYNSPGAANDGQVSQEIGYAAYGLSDSAINLLKHEVNDVEDVRSYLICDLGIPNTDYKGYRKYVGEVYHFVYNQPVVRLPEIYLSLAEAYLEKDNVSSAEIYYKKLREVRVKDSSGFGSSSISVCLDKVLEERRRELMLEGHTFWDFFRKRKVMKRDKIIENVNKITIVFDEGKDYYRPQVVYPIPLPELEANKAIRDQQNNRYETYDQVYKIENSN